MKNASRAARAFLAAIAAIAASSCINFPETEQDPSNLDLSKVGTIGLIVARMGNTTMFGCPVPITSLTDYANEKPRTKAVFLIDMAEEDAVMEGAGRIARSFPHYPYWEMFRRNIRWEKHYKNISAPLYARLSSSLGGLGYAVVDARAALAAKGKDPFQMKVGGIVKELSAGCDLILVLHYADMGEYHYGDGSRDPGGFTRFNYSYAAFDAADGARLAAGSVATNVAELLAADPDIQSDVSLRSRIRSSNGVIEHDFTDEEIVGFLASTILRGATVADSNGDMHVIKGLSAFLRKR
jgi:hypothetical protein